MGSDKASDISSMESSPVQAQHFLFVTSPLQGHINPARRLAARLVALMPEARLTFSTAVSGHRLMFPSLASPDEETVDGVGVLYAPFSDGFDEGFKPELHGMDSYGARAPAVGRETLSALVDRLAARGFPVTCVVYTFLTGWVPDVARAHGIPAALYWIQPATVFAVYYRYFHGHDAALTSCTNDPDPGATVHLPGLPPLKSDVLPSLVSVTSSDNIYYVVLDLVRGLFSALDEHKPKVLVNTFDALEPDALRAVPQFELVAVGPVVPEEASPSSTDLFRRDDNKAYMEWLDAQPARSVVYVSFGSIISVNKRQEEEMRRGLEATGRPYLWVARRGAEVDGASLDSTYGGYCAGGQGMVVEWCDQVRVLSHPSVGCFMTHCGWNSTLESITRGVPMVAVPQWMDQPTVAWLASACAGVGVRARVDGDGVIERAEIQRCVEMVMGDGDNAVEIRAQAESWMERAKDAVAGGGTSERNLRAFVSGL